MARSFSPQRGCTLIEMLFLITLLALVWGVVLALAIRQLHSAQHRFTQRQLVLVAARLPAYRAATGRACPRSIGELYRLGLVDQLPLLDAWKRPLVIDCGKTRESPPLGLRSAGPDQTLYTEDDLCSYPRARPVPVSRPWPWRRALSLLLLLLPLLLLRRWAPPAKGAI